MDIQIQNLDATTFILTLVNVLIYWISNYNYL